MQNMSCLEIRQIIAESIDKSKNFGEVLIDKKVSHISFSMISSYEFCERRYFLEYVKRKKLSPKPLYFIKGEVFHDQAAKFYNRISNPPLLKELIKVTPLAKKLKHDWEMINHMKNALTLLYMNYWRSYNVVAVEKPFVIRLDQRLPPFVGIVDLILKKDKTYFIIDHKTGKYIYYLDKLQAEIYREFIYKQYRSPKCELYYDQYRWVNNLDKIKIPAFQRSKVKLNYKFSNTSLKRILKTYKGMTKILSGEKPSNNGECYMCPYRQVCYSLSK